VKTQNFAEEKKTEKIERGFTQIELINTDKKILVKEKILMAGIFSLLPKFCLGRH